MKKAILFALFGLICLFWVGLVTGLQVFEPWYSTSVDRPGTAPSAPGEMSWDSYKKIKIAFGSFDLVNGLTKQDLETMNTDPTRWFYYLLACLWLALGLRFVAPRRPRRE